MNDQELPFELVYPMPEIWIRNKHYEYLIEHQEHGEPAIKDWEEYYNKHKDMLDRKYIKEMSL